MNSKTFPAIALALAIAILGVVGYKLAPTRGDQADIVLPISACNLSEQSCAATLPAGTPLTFSIEPRPIKALQALHLTLGVNDPEIENVTADFNGTDMEMGDNRVSLTKDARGYVGQAMLPVCVTGTMSWTATMYLTRKGQRIALPFQFVVSGR